VVPLRGAFHFRRNNAALAVLLSGASKLYPQPKRAGALRSVGVFPTAFIP